MVKLAGLEESVFFLGNRNDVPDCLNAMDLFALPSFGNEGVPQRYYASDGFADYRWYQPRVQLVKR